MKKEKFTYIVYSIDKATNKTIGEPQEFKEFSEAMDYFLPIKEEFSKTTILAKRFKNSEKNDDVVAIKRKKGN